MNLRLSIFGILLLLLVPVSSRAADARQWTGEPVIIDALNVDVTDPYASGFDWSGLARALIGMSRGDTLTGDRLEQARKALEPLAQVQTSVAVSDQGATVTIDLQPFKRIKNIDIDGSYPLFYSDVLKVMTVAKAYEV